MIEKWLSANAIAELLSVQGRSIRRRAELEAWHKRMFRGNGGQQWKYYLPDLPEDIQLAYATSLKTSLKELQDQLKPVPKPSQKVVIPAYTCRSASVEEVKTLEQCTEADRNIAILRLQVIEAYNVSGLTPKKFIEAYEAGIIVPEVKVRLERWGHLHTQSIFYKEWLQRYSLYGLAGLAPQYKGRGGPGASLSDEAKDRIEWLYLDSSRPTPAQVTVLLEQYNIKAKDATVRRYIKTLPASLVARFRMGEKYFHDKFEPYIERDYTLFRSMEVICGDYMTEDLVCRLGERVFRAKLCAFEDMRSRLLVGWSLQLTANSVGVVRSLQMAVENYGLPGAVYVDNGKEFKNYWLCGDEWKLRRTSIDRESLEQDAGILNECGVKVVFCQPYHGQSKPIERLWRTFHEWFDKFAPTYVGSNTATRPDEAKLYRANVEDISKVDISQIPEFEWLESKIGEWAAWYNEKRTHSGQGMNDKTPVQVFKENAEPKRELPENLKKYVFTLRWIRTVQKDGVNLDGTWYFTKELQQFVGQQVEVRRGLDNAGKVHIFNMPDRKYLFDADDLTWSGVAEEDIRRVNKLRKEARELQTKYNKKKAEYDAGPFKTPSEIHAMETTRQTELKVVNGEPLVFESNPAPRLTLVKTDGQPKRKIRLPTDPD